MEGFSRIIYPYLVRPADFRKSAGRKKVVLFRSHFNSVIGLKN